MKTVALAGGVGGAKLVEGLAAVLRPQDLTVIVNTGDDFEHLGLLICPDLDTILYTLAGVANPQTGWGRADESWNFLETLGRLGGPTWFRLGDRDLALHVVRTQRLEQGQPLSRIIAELCREFGVQVKLLPMSDQPVRTIVQTAEGELAFQEYFVALRCQPVISGFRFDGIEGAKPAPGAIEAIEESDLVVMCPSNPWVSIDPILAVPGLKPAIRAKPVVGVSPIVGGRAVKGPAAKMCAELGIEPTAISTAEHYGDVLTGWVIDHQDAHLAEAIRALGIRVHVTDTMMVNAEVRRDLAAQVLAFTQEDRVRP